MLAKGSQEIYYGKRCELGGINQFEIISMIRGGKEPKNRCFVMILNEFGRVWVQIKFDFVRRFFMIAATRDFFFFQCKISKGIGIFLTQGVCFDVNFHIYSLLFACGVVFFNRTHDGPGDVHL